MTELSKALLASGWSSLPSGSFQSGGFVVAGTTQIPQYATFCAQDKILTAEAGPTANGNVQFALSVVSIQGAYPGSATQCGRSLMPSTIPPPGTIVYGLLPRLVLPAQTTVVTSSSTGSGHMAGSLFTVESSDSIKDLRSALVRQLESDGWKSADDVTSATTSVSTWRKTVKGTEVQAVLTILRAIGGERRRDLMISVSQRPPARAFTRT